MSTVTIMIQELWRVGNQKPHLLSPPTFPTPRVVHDSVSQLSRYGGRALAVNARSSSF